MEPIDLNDDLPVVDELTSLKARADLMGITYHPSIGVEKLREKVAAGIAGETLKDEPVVLTKEQPQAEVAAAAPVVLAEETFGQKRLRLKRESLALIRIRVACMNPAKKEWEGEFITAGNNLIGSVTKYVPYNTDDGWHVPTIVYKVLRDRMCQIFIESKDSRGNKVRKGKMIKEFAIEVMDQLTPEELAELAARQAATRSID